ncbi:MAG: hypothetical protein ACLU22_00320 [Clostridium sp.]
MSLAKRRKNLFVFFLVACLVLTTTLGAAPNLSQAKKKKQGITVTNKMTKGVLVIQEKKEITVKAKVARKKSFIQEDKEDIQIQVFKQKDCDSE